MELTQNTEHTGWKEGHTDKWGPRSVHRAGFRRCCGVSCSCRHSGMLAWVHAREPWFSVQEGTAKGLLEFPG